MNKYMTTALLLGCFTFTGTALAQLSDNPWLEPNEEYSNDTSEPAASEDTQVSYGADVGDASPTGDVNEDYSGDVSEPSVVVSASGNSGDSSGILPVDPWAKTRDTSGVKTWRGSGQHGKLDYIGEATSWDGEGTAGQELMPEVNRHNIAVFTDHLRKMGYKIPDSFDQNIQDMPQNYKRRLEESISDLNTAKDPLSQSFKLLMNSFEDGTGLDLNNILFNTMDILGTD